jgi:hypothetical protein
MIISYLYRLYDDNQNINLLFLILFSLCSTLFFMNNRFFLAIAFSLSYYCALTDFRMSFLYIYMHAYGTEGEQSRIC